MDRQLENLLQRGVDALEKLAQDEFEIQVETKPPVCPHCGMMNPTVRVSESATSGALAEFVIQAFCNNCKNIFYVIPLQTECVKTQDEARNVISDKVRIGGYEGQNSGAPVGSDASRSNGL